ncbi:MAG TPA: heavy metal-associated domain-containing protein [Bacteroidota bacterium]|nr:heavy metal-associated domain-containing protein [Bacteroidota bacterium]
MKTMKMLKFVLAPSLLLLLYIVRLPGGETPKSVRINIEGMTCGGCATKIEKAVGRLEGIGKTTLNVKEGYADVVFAQEKVSTDEIVRAIADAGYRAALAPEGETPALQKPGDPPAPNAKLDDIRARLTKIKNGLMVEGKYSCCIAPSCDFCALAMNGCPCGDNLAKGKPVCNECKGGWTAGYGTMPDIDPKTVKALPDEEMKKMYKNRSDLIKKSRPSGEEKK